MEKSGKASQTVYMLYEKDQQYTVGPYVGVPGLNFPSLVAEFRVERYAKAEAAGDDYCFVGLEELVCWLRERGTLVPLETVAVSVEIDTNGKNRYTPKHWPICPQCGAGRGEEVMGEGRVRRALNRAEWHRQCAECGHVWDHHDVPYDSRKPMLEDDGRCIPNGCVPYAISQACALPITEVLDVCRRHGWHDSEGMEDTRAIAAVDELGWHMIPGVAHASGKVTLRRLLDSLSPRKKNYIVATKDHWLAVVKGENRDQAEMSMRTLVRGCWEVQRKSHA